MNKSSIAAACVAAVLSAAPAAADEWYVNAGGAAFFDGDAALGALLGRLGYEFYDVGQIAVSVEGEAAFGIIDETVDVAGFAADVELDNAFGGFGVVTFEFPGGLNLFARGGFQAIRLEATAGFGEAGDREVGAAFGGGVEYYLFDRLGVRAEYTRFESDDADLNQLGLAAVLRFG